MSLLITFTNAVFAVTIQSAPTPSGPWTTVVTSQACATTNHSFSVEKTKRVEFYRFIPNDNGKAPTPGIPELYRQAERVYLVCPPVYECPSSGIRRYHWYRDGVLVHTTTEPAVFDDPEPGMHLYQSQIETDAGLSWLSNYGTIVL